MTMLGNEKLNKLAERVPPWALEGACTLIDRGMTFDQAVEVVIDWAIPESANWHYTASQVLEVLVDLITQPPYLKLKAAFEVARSVLATATALNVAPTMAGIHVRLALCAFQGVVDDSD